MIEYRTLKFEMNNFLNYKIKILRDKNNMEYANMLHIPHADYDLNALPRNRSCCSTPSDLMHGENCNTLLPHLPNILGPPR